MKRRKARCPPAEYPSFFSAFLRPRFDAFQAGPTLFFSLTFNLDFHDIPKFPLAFRIKRFPHLLSQSCPYRCGLFSPLSIAPRVCLPSLPSVRVSFFSSPLDSSQPDQSFFRPFPPPSSTGPMHLRTNLLTLVLSHFKFCALKRRTFRSFD